ncbi:MAG: hypothetical protein PSV16_07980 [Flavobacterium sp.]|nr:hypothetical protein [Flavobacterium sp.]
MKILKSIAALLLVASIWSCHRDDDNNNVPENLIGHWKLVNVSGGIAGINQPITDGAVTWEFNSNNTVTIVNAGDDDYTGLASGTYPYAFVNSDVPESCAEKLAINNTQSGGCLTFTTDGKMLISDNYADGFTLEFEHGFSINQ